MPTNQCRRNVKNHHLATINHGYRMIQGKNYQWMLKLVGETLMRNKISIQLSSKYLLQREKEQLYSKETQQISP